MISHSYRFIFVHINKTGGTSIEKLFDRAADQRDVKLKHPPISYYQQNYPQAFHDYFKFAFVRNPWDWLVSRYHWSKDKQMLFDYSFDAFLMRLKNGESLSSHAPWLESALRPQIARLQIDGQFAMDFVGRFESLQQDFHQICEQLNLISIPLPHVFATRRGNYTDYYRPETRDLVAELYALDIESFGYRFEPSPVLQVKLELPVQDKETDPINTVRIVWPDAPMSLYDQLSLASFARQGHRVEVYSYGIIPKIEGVFWRDAATILPEPEIHRLSTDKRAFANFLHLFCFQLLYEKGGIWANTELFCLNSLSDLPQACLALDANGRISDRFFRFPPRHPLIQDLRDHCLNTDELKKTPLLKKLNSLLPHW